MQHISKDTENNLTYFTASLSAFPAENLGTLVALIVIASPVLGLRPFLAFLFDILNAPNPTRVTACPFFKADVMEEIVALRALPASAFDNPEFEETFSINSSFVIFPSLSLVNDCYIN
jgi:hypothetical protein